MSQRAKLRLALALLLAAAAVFAVQFLLQDKKARPSEAELRQQEVLKQIPADDPPPPPPPEMDPGTSRLPRKAPGG